MNSKFRVSFAVAFVAVTVFLFESLSEQLFAKSVKDLADFLNSVDRASASQYDKHRFLPSFLMVAEDFLFFLLPFTSLLIVGFGKSQLGSLTKGYLCFFLGLLIGRSFSGSRLFDAQTLQALPLSLLGFAFIVTILNNSTRVQSNE